MRTKNPTSKTILWSVLAGLVIGLIGCGSSDGGTMPADGSMMTTDSGPVYSTCSTTADNGMECSAPTCTTMLDSNGISVTIATPAGICMGTACVHIPVSCGFTASNSCTDGVCKSN
jgi:hypothetical protein